MKLEEVQGVEHKIEVDFRLVLAFEEWVLAIAIDYLLRSVEVEDSGFAGIGTENQRSETYLDHDQCFCFLVLDASYTARTVREVFFEEIVKNVAVLGRSCRTGSEFTYEFEVLANDLGLAVLGNLLGV